MIGANYKQYCGLSVVVKIAFLYFGAKHKLLTYHVVTYNWFLPLCEKE